MLKLTALVALLAISGCRKDTLGPTGVQIDLLTSDAKLSATTFHLVWLDDNGRLFEVRVPEEGFIDDVQAPVVSVFVALDASKVGQRRIFVRGYRDDQPISEGTARILTGANLWVQIGIPMGPVGRLQDTDADGLPDPVDNCPRQPDPCTDGLPPAVDAGGDDAGDDGGGGGGDDAGDGGGADGGADSGADSMPYEPTGFPDGGGDKPTTVPGRPA